MNPIVDSDGYISINNNPSEADYKGGLMLYHIKPSTCFGVSEHFKILEIVEQPRANCKSISEANSEYGDVTMEDGSSYFEISFIINSIKSSGLIFAQSEFTEDGTALL